jgi:hypothetical protein
MYAFTATITENEDETKHLMAMEGAADRLKLFEMDVLNPESVLAAIKGTVGVFHLATPLDAPRDPEVTFCLLLSLINNQTYSIKSNQIFNSSSYLLWIYRTCLSNQLWRERSTCSELPKSAELDVLC